MDGLMKMKKGIAPVVIGFILIMLIVFGVIVAFATNASRAGLTKKHLFEASLISESDKVETYARSFLRATDLSLIQSIHNVGNDEIIMPYDLNSYYNKTYNLSFWEISSDSENDILIPPKEILYNKFRQEISWTTSCYLKNYFDAYKNFASQDGFIFSGTPIAKVDILSNDSIRVLVNDVSIHRTTIAEDREIEINKVFKPFSEISSEFGNITDKAEELINDDKIGKCIRDASGICSHDKTKKDDTQKALDKLASSLSTSNITYIFTVLDFKVSGPGGEIEDVVVNVSIFDNITNYTVYSLNDDEAIIDYLGVEFLVLVYKTGDESWANSQYVFASDIARQCSSKINLISPRTTDDICQYFNVNPTTCDDSDGGLDYTVSGSCTDFTGFYGDLCFDLNNDGESETLYEYGCHSSNICYFNKHPCVSGCVNNACVIACSQDSDCDDSNVCTQNICQDAGLDTARCENPPEPSTTSCGTTTRDCSSSNCQCEGDDWICETDTDKTCTRYCDGTGGCGTCAPSVCDKVDSGCCADSDCPVGTPLCHLPTHTCYRCIFDSDCPQDGFYCNGNVREQRDYYCNPGPGDCSYNIISSENCNGYDGSWCNGDIKETRDYSCSGSGTSAVCSYSVSATENCNAYDRYYCYNTNIREYRDYTCSGAGPSSSCSYSWSDRKTCNYDCKDGTDCWQGLWCPSVGGRDAYPGVCGDSCDLDAGICWDPCWNSGPTGECFTPATCIREGDAAPTCTWTDLWMTCFCPLPCCCSGIKTCNVATCSYDESCTYT